LIFFSDTLYTINYAIKIIAKVVSTSKLFNEAFTTAVKYRLTFYDSLYIALAKIVKGELVTADTKLAEVIVANNLCSVRIITV